MREPMPPPIPDADRQQPYDLLIVGGGVNGCGIARDAAGRGLRVALCEMGDLAQGDLGVSFSQRKPVVEVLVSRIPNTLLTLAVCGNKKKIN